MGFEGYYEDTGIGFYLFIILYKYFVKNIVNSIKLFARSNFKFKKFSNNSIQFISLKTFYDTSSPIYNMYKIVHNTLIMGDRPFHIFLIIKCII